MLIQTKTVLSLKINQVTINNIHNIPGISDHDTLYNNCVNDPLVITYMCYKPVFKDGSITKEYLKFTRYYLAKLQASLKPEWYERV